jgi:arsenate reductase-like glutaredoxin family protein
MKKKHLIIALFSIVVLGLNSCKKDDNTKSYDVPTSYNFDSVDYSGQTARLDMLTELINEMKKGRTIGTQVSAQKLKDLYSNTNSPFTAAALNTSGKQLKDKTFVTEQAVIEGYMDDLALASQASAAGSQGNAGVVGGFLLDGNGAEHNEWIQKSILGALVYYQITAVYLDDAKIGSSLAKSVRQHSWDEAFGYFGVPKDYPSNKTGIRHLGKYGNDRDSLLGNNTAAMNAYLKGRAALNNEDNEEVTKQVAIIRENLEKGVAGTAIHYINEAIKGFGTDGTRCHTMSEAVGLVRALRYNPAKKITDTEITNVLNTLGTNNYNVTLNDLNTAKNTLSSIYGLNSVKDQL